MPERSRGLFTRDPFAIAPDPDVYVPRAATETARKELLRSACNPAKTSALIGPPGLGKTLLLHLLAKEVPEDMQTVYLPYAALPPAELCAWALDLLGSPAADDPIGALEALGRDLRERGSSLLMSVDDVGAMPIATARWVGEFVQNLGGSVRLAVAASDNATGNRVIAAIGSNFDIVHLDDPMTESETRKYIDGRLALARVPDSIRARFDDRIVRLLHRVSAGIPRRLHSAAAEILQEAPPASSADAAIAPAAPVESVESEPIESEEVYQPPVPDREPPTSPRRSPSASRRAIALGSLLVAFVAVAIPVIRSILAEPREIAAIELRTDPQELVRGDSRESMQGDLRESIQGNSQEKKRASLREPSAAIGPDGSAPREVAGEARTANRAAESQINGPPAVRPPPVESFGPLAVQINASPWANIEVDGIDLGVTPLANIPLFAGEHSFRARMPDGRVVERTVEIDAERRFITFE